MILRSTFGALNIGISLIVTAKKKAILIELIVVELGHLINRVKTRNRGGEFFYFLGKRIRAEGE